MWYTVYRNLNLIQNKRKRISLTVLSAVPISCYLYFLSAHLSASPEESVSRLWCCSFISFRNLGASDWNLRLVWWRWMFLLAVTHGINPSSINFMWQDVKLKMCWEIFLVFSSLALPAPDLSWQIAGVAEGDTEAEEEQPPAEVAVVSAARAEVEPRVRTQRGRAARGRGLKCVNMNEYLSELCEHEWEYEIIGILQTFVSEILKGAVFNLLAVFKSSSLFLLVPALNTN